MDRTCLLGSSGVSELVICIYIAPCLKLARYSEQVQPRAALQRSLFETVCAFTFNTPRMTIASAPHHAT
eukprot:scaffold13388_cov20-Tisochrysis_lutea.AAC.1